jgi:carbamoyl-phosphate synthase large subunit
LGYPDRLFVIKINRGTGAQGFKVVYPSLAPGQRMMDRDNRIVAFDELRRWLQEWKAWPPLHVAEYLPGNEYSVDILCSKGEVISVVTRLRLSMYYGLALHAEVVKEPNIEKVACDVVSNLGLSFVVNVQIRVASDGTPKLIEVNPRIPGTIGLTIASGINMPYFAIKMALGERFDVSPPRIGMKILRYWGGVYVSPNEILQ